ncbi:MAG: hypothetical protein CBD98_004065 [Flavobacteriaceae bacterium TMED238]|nr:MAG: hypothetical protein CBD98_004065 [Flavobacteriaceae bacterium TMED238]
MYSITIDIGGTYIKGATLDIKKKRILNLKKIKLPKFIKNKNTNFCELDPNLIFFRTKKLINLLLKKNKNISDLFISSQMHGCVLINSQLKTKTNFISWQDQRAGEIYKKTKKSYFEVMKKKIGKKRISLCGNEIKIGYPISSIWCLSQRGKNLSNLTPLPLSDYILTKLSGKIPPIHHTHASGMGVYNLFTKSWDNVIIKKLNLNNISWPQVTHLEKIVGFTMMNGKKINCWSTFGDQQTAVLACKLKKNELSINIATGSQVGVIINKPKIGDYQLRPFFGNRYLKTITHLPAGRSLNSLTNLLQENFKNQNSDKIWNYIKRKVVYPTSTNLITNISFFPNKFGNTGFIKNISEKNLTISNLFSSAFENMADNYYQSAKKIIKFSKLKKIVFSGGLVRKIPITQKIIAKKLKCNYRTCSSVDSSLMGLALIAFSKNKNKKTRGHL